MVKKIKGLREARKNNFKAEVRRKMRQTVERKRRNRKKVDMYWKGKRIRVKKKQGIDR